MKMDSRSKSLWMLATASLLALGSSGCLATHKYVNTQAVDPLNAKIQKVDAKTGELDSRISDVDRRAEQGISDASNKAETADQNAQKANQAAQGAQQTAQGAQETADKGVTAANQAQQQIDNIDNYQPVKSESVLFGFNRSNLTDQDKQQLDSLAQSLPSLKHYAIEVKGFTDHIGSKDYNLELSRRRADSVVRYLTEDAHVPLVKIHVVGLGEDEPVADNKTKEGRKENRRVEVRIMSPQAAEQQQASGATPTGQ
jgi:OmpA-OmpF porin, OOP family